MKKKVVRRKAGTRTTKPSRKTLSTPIAGANDKAVRQHLLCLLKESGAHATFDAAIGDWPVQLAGVKVANFPHTAWMLLEHIRIAQWDILEFSRNPKHMSPDWPDGYWPETERPPSDAAWEKSLASIKKDLLEMEKLVENPKTDLYAKI